MRNRCIVCEAPLWEKPLYACKNMPSVSQNLPTADTLSHDQPIHANMRQCMGCGLVQFDCDPVSYYKDSTRANERCASLTHLRETQYKYFIEHYHLQGKKIVEIGAGKGGFLKTLKECSQSSNYRVQEYGLEWNPNFVTIAREKEGVNMQQGDPECETTKIAGAPFDAFTSFAYPARLIHPNAMMQCIYKNTTKSAVGFIQVPSFEHLIQPGGFFDLTIDHIAYYDASSLQFLLQKNGFHLLEHGFVSNLYLYAIVQKRQPYDLQTAWADIEPLKKQFQDFVAENTKNQKKIAVWCAGHFAFVTLATTDTGSKIAYIIDKAPLKQNRYAPISHVPIVSPKHYTKEPVDMIIILAPLYIDEIVQEIRTLCGSHVKIAAMDYGKGIYRIS